MKLGSGDVSFRLGNITPGKVYLGSTEVWSDGPPPVVPDAVAIVNVATSTTTASAADISWDAPADGGAAITAYNIYYSNDFGTTYILHGTDASSPYEMEIPFRGGNSVYVDVRAVNSVGEGPTTLMVGNATLSDSVPGELTITSVTQQPGADLFVEWSGPEYTVTPAITEYEIEYTPVTGIAQFVTTANLGYYTLELNNIDINVVFGFRVRASNDAGYGPYSEAVYQTAADVPGSTTPSANTGTGEPGSVELSLNLPDANGSPILSYDIQADLDGTFASPVISETYEDIPGAGGSWIKIIAGLAGGTQHYFRVRFTNAVGVSEYSSSHTATSTATPPAQVTGFSVTPNYSDAASSLHQWDFAWTAPSDGGDAITGYEIEQSEYEDFGDVEVFYPTPGETYTDLADYRDVTRYFRIRAVNSLGGGAYSAVVSAYYTTPTVPGAPTINGATYLVDGETLVEYTDGSGEVTSRTFYFDGNVVAPDSDSAGAAYFNAPGSSPGHRVGQSVTMTNTNAVGEGPLSDPILVAADFPGAPTGLAGYNNTTLYWTDPDNGGSEIVAYLVYVTGTDGDGTTYNDTDVTAMGTITDPSTVGGDVEWYSDSLFGNDLVWSVSADNGIGEGPRSDELTYSMA